MTLPEGLIYVPGFLAEAGERDVLAVLATFEPACVMVCAWMRTCGMPTTGWA
jgi:hypothetical protein